MDVCARFYIHAKREICTGNEGMNQTKISDVVRPTSIIVHKDKNHYGSRREADIESIYKPLEVGNYMILERYQSLRVISFHMCMVKES